MMIDLYYWATPNGHKITIMLEETGLDYQLIPVDIRAGDQFKTDFLRISPNNRMPAIVDHNALGDQPLAIFESGAILLYLAEKTERFLPRDLRGRYEVLQWLFWQVAGLGPMAGQNHHFSHYANDKIPYAIERYRNETARLYAVLDKQLQGKDYIASHYSIADMACYPWIVPFEYQGQDLNQFPNLSAWFFRMQNRPAVKRAYALADQFKTETTMSAEAKKILFGQSDKTINR